MPTHPTPPDPARFATVGRGILAYPRFLWGQLRAWFQDMWIIGLATVLGIVLMIPITVHTIPSGSVGVVWKRFAGGTDMAALLTEGTAVIMPWNKLFLYETRLQSGDNYVSALSADGLKVEVDMAWAFYLVPTAASMVHKGIGPEYKDKVVIRVIESVVRDKVSLFRSEELHSPERATFEKQVYAGIMTEIGRFSAINRLSANYQPTSGETPDTEKGVDWISLDAVLIKEIRFPPAVQEAYVRKNTARALVEEYNFRIVAEQKEVERKMVEALGIRNFQEVVNQGLSESYLRWKGIEASVANTQALAQSPNAKLVVLGTGTGTGSGTGGGMPMILNTNALDAMEGGDRSSGPPAASRPRDPTPQPRSAPPPPRPARSASMAGNAVPVPDAPAAKVPMPAAAVPAVRPASSTAEVVLPASTP
jgi:regulator of protease activity HflC (stomatin/prohibitin superfamily)